MHDFSSPCASLFRWFVNCKIDRKKITRVFCASLAMLMFVYFFSAASTSKWNINAFQNKWRLMMMTLKSSKLWRIIVNVLSNTYLIWLLLPVESDDEFVNGFRISSKLFSLTAHHFELNFFEFINRLWVSVFFLNYRFFPVRFFCNKAFRINRKRVASGLKTFSTIISLQPSKKWGWKMSNKTFREL